ncbi:MAG: glycosyltransferase [Vitreoscilla sp.]
MTAPSKGPQVLLVALGTAGDLYPFLRIARELLARGHRVTLLGLQAHAAAVARAGVPFHGLGTEEEYRATLDHPDVWHPRKGFGVLWAGMRERIDALPDYLATLPADEPVVMLAHPLALAGAALARPRRPGMRVVAAWLAPANLRTVHDPMTFGPLRMPRWMPLAWRHWLWRRVDARIIDPVAVPDINAAHARHGLPPIRHFIDHMQGAADAHLSLFPSWFTPTPPDWPRPLSEGVFPLYDPQAQAPLPPVLARFLADGSPPLILTPGSGNRQARRWLARAVRAAQRLGRRAVLLTPHREQVPEPLPPDILWLPYVALRTLLPHAAALVHHGGIGTTAEALRAGLPQVIVPLAYDQFDNAARVEALGAGVMVAGGAGGARPRALAAALRRSLESEAIRAGCARVAARCAADAMHDLAAQVEILLGLAPAK